MPPIIGFARIGGRDEEGEGQSGHWSNYFVKIHEKQDKMSSGQQKAESWSRMDQILKNWCTAMNCYG